MSKTDAPTSRRTLSGTVRMRLDEYETRLLHGERQITFVEELQRDGFNVTYGMFRTLLWRARNHIVAKPRAIPETQQVGNVVETKPSQPPTPPAKRKINSPKDIEAILSGEIDLDN